MRVNDSRAGAPAVLPLSEASLRANQLAEMLDSSSQAFALHYADARLSIFNTAFARLLGYTWEELKHLDWESITPPEWRKGEREKLAELHRTGAPVRYEMEYVRKGGKRVPVELYLNLHTDQQGQADYSYVFITDITIRKRAEELRSHIERIIQHDLRGPVASAIQLAKLLREGGLLNEEQRCHLLGLFEQLGQDMLDTLDSTLALYKMETGDYELAAESIDCLAMLQALAGTLVQKAEFTGVRLVLLVDGERPAPDARCLCLGEPKLLRAALRNLLRNALQAAHPGGTVVMEVSRLQGCRLEIRNTGAVPVDIRSRFFEKYVTSGKASGTGLGTYSARMLLRAQGGDVTMRTSEADNQTVVTVQMPSQVEAPKSQSVG